MIKKLLITLSALTMVPGIAEARSWPETGGWGISQGSDFCVMSNEFEGPGDSEMFVTLYDSGMILLGVFNSNWSSKDDEVYDDITAAMGDIQYGGSQAIGLTLDGKSGFGIKLHPSMLNALAGASSIRLYKGDAKMDHLNLSGTGVAIAMVKRCLATVKAENAAAAAAEAREKARYSGIAKDPFAK